MKFFLIVTFLMANTAALDRPMYVFKNPSFDSMQECKEYVSVMHMKIYQTRLRIGTLKKLKILLEKVGMMSCLKLILKLMIIQKRGYFIQLFIIQ